MEEVANATAVLICKSIWNFEFSVKYILINRFFFLIIGLQKYLKTSNYSLIISFRKDKII